MGETAHPAVEAVNRSRVDEQETKSDISFSRVILGLMKVKCCEMSYTGCFTHPDTVQRGLGGNVRWLC
jgi:hypothetical protein